jgi:hypothetical protein
MIVAALMLVSSVRSFYSDAPPIHQLQLGKRKQSENEWNKHRDAVRKGIAPRGNERRVDAEIVTPVGSGYGTHHAYLWVGSPPQRQTVILDTGSTRTVINNSA